MKKGWENKVLGELCSFVNGDRGENYPSKSVQTSSGVPFINAGHLSESGIDFSNMNYIPRARFELLGSGKIRKDDVLFCLRGSLGKFASVCDLNEGAIASSLVIIRPSNALLNKFFLAYLQSDLCAEMILTFKNGAAQPNLAAASLKKFQIPVPPLVEQHRIVAILEEAFEAIATAKANTVENLQNARQFFETYLEEVFAGHCSRWPETSLGEIASIKGGKRVPKGYKLLEDDTGYPYLRVTDFDLRGSIDTSDLRYVSAAVHAEIKNYIITSKDLYISIAGTIGRTGIIPDELNGAHLTENACRLVFNSGVNNRFVYYYSKTPAFIEQTGLNTRTAAQPKLALSRLATIRMPMPAAEIQTSVVATLEMLADLIESLEELYRFKAIALGELKKSLLHQAFTGTLTAKSADQQVAEVA